MNAGRMNLGPASPGHRHPGTDQRQRFPAALEDGAFQVDPTRLDERLAMTGRLARQLLFFDLQDREAGDWGELFLGDESCVLARILATDLEVKLAEFLRDLRKPNNRAVLAAHVVELALEIDLWYKSLAANTAHAAVAIRERIRELVSQHLAADMKPLLDVSTARGLFRNGDPAGGFQRIALARSWLDPIWHPTTDSRGTETGWSVETPLSVDAQDVERRRSVEGGFNADERSEVDALRRCFSAFLGAMSRVQELARELLRDSLVTQSHAPAAGLLLAFAQLMSVIQRQVNQFTDRHIDFYYSDCLRFTPRPGRLESAHLVCTRNARFAREVSIGAGTMILAGKDAAGNDIEFRTDSDVVLSDARIEKVAMLLLERDRLISPERDFDYVTRVKATPPMAVGLSDPARTTRRWPLFGGAGGEDARIGLAIATPLLLLQEGTREIRVTLRFSATTPADFETLVTETVHATDARGFNAAAGRLLSRWLLSADDPLSAADLEAIRQTAARISGRTVPVPDHASDLLNFLAAGAPPKRDLMLNALFASVLRVLLSTADGWLEMKSAFVRRPPAEEAGGRAALQIVLRLRPEDPAVVGCVAAVHGPQWRTQQPVFQLLLQPRAHLYAYSLLCDAMLDDVTVAVHVTGVRNVVVYNNYGRLDPSKPFAPFGPLPSLSSYLVLGAPEITRKHLESLTLNLEWGRLPQDDSGFEAYYRAYGTDWQTESFTSTVALLHDGQWHGAGSRPLFALDPESDRLQSSIGISVDEAAVRKHWRASSEACPFDKGARNGYVRVQLAGPPGAFGHEQYPTLLSETVTENARRKQPLKLPNPPYTPLLERLTLDYRARSTLSLVGAAVFTAAGVTGTVMHLLPFGIQALEPVGTGGYHPLLPRADDDGNLYIGISANQPPQRLSLLFHMSDAAAAAGSAAPPRIHWAALCADQWRALTPAQMLADSTEGFLTSGIITIDIPAEITRENQRMPADLYWLRVATTVPDFKVFARLRGIYAHAVRVRRVSVAGPAPAEPVFQTRVAIPGLASIVQVGRVFDRLAPENTRSMRTRAGERLRHKCRASTVWDIERLVLEHSPEVFKVKCFPPTVRYRGSAPGRVLVAVVPTVRRNDSSDSTRAPRINAAGLKRIGDYLRGLASPWMRFEVLNVAYERIQVRCCVKLTPGTATGLALRRINEAIIEYLSPWWDGGRGPVFDWVIRCEDVEAHLRKLESVEFVTCTSLLHVAEDEEESYTLGDTARLNSRVAVEELAAATQGSSDEVRASCPWSIALPMSSHLVTLLDADGATDSGPIPTGIGRLGIGSTFIVGPQNLDPPTLGPRGVL